MDEEVTRFYRPPELLLEATFYSPLVDVWSGGCVYGELLRGGVLFPGRDAKHQLKLIVDTLGIPSDDEMNDMGANASIEGGRTIARGFKPILPHASAESVALIKRILVYRPKLRLCNTPLLMDPFFDELFIPDKRRKNGSYISNVITVEDLTIIRRKSKMARHGGIEKKEVSESSRVQSQISQTSSEAPSVSQGCEPSLQESKQKPQ
uniref:Protein kinase domain-containing protein n=1 Tax=Ascaris lumbricoides TaxID=6252 RepID=A0A0M3IEM6_ASCLU